MIELKVITDTDTWHIRCQAEGYELRDGWLVVRNGLVKLNRTMSSDTGSTARKLLAIPADNIQRVEQI